MEHKPAKKIRWRITVFDVLIMAVVVVAAAAALLVWRSTGGSSKTPSSALNTHTLRYTIELTGMAGDTADLVSEGDTIIDSTKKYIMGTVLSVDVTVTTTATKNLETGGKVNSEVPDKHTATIVLECTCTETDAQIYTTSGYLVRVGEEVQATGPGYAGLGYVIDIERADD